VTAKQPKSFTGHNWFVHEIPEAFFTWPLSSSLVAGRRRDLTVTFLKHRGQSARNALKFVGPLLDRLKVGQAPGQSTSRFLIEGVSNLFLTMYPFSISTDEHVSLIFLIKKRLSKKTKICWILMEPFHILEYLEVTNTQMDFSILLITLNVPLRMSKCTRRVHLPQVGIPALEVLLLYCWNIYNNWCFVRRIEEYFYID